MKNICAGEHLRISCKVGSNSRYSSHTLDSDGPCGAHPLVTDRAVAISGCFLKNDLQIRSKWELLQNSVIY